MAEVGAKSEPARGKPRRTMGQRHRAEMGRAEDSVANRAYCCVSADARKSAPHHLSIRAPSRTGCRQPITSAGSLHLDSRLPYRFGRFNQCLQPRQSCRSLFDAACKANHIAADRHLGEIMLGCWDGRRHQCCLHQCIQRHARWYVDDRQETHKLLGAACQLQRHSWQLSEVGDDPIEATSSASE
jgi:hypothetical protein